MFIVEPLKAELNVPGYSQSYVTNIESNNVKENLTIEENSKKKAPKNIKGLRDFVREKFQNNNSEILNNLINLKGVN